MFPLSLRDAAAIGSASGDSAAFGAIDIGHNGRIAQLVEQLTLNQRVLGSSPSVSTKFLIYSAVYNRPFIRSVLAPGTV
jgi:hypothetical protein